MDPSDDNSFDLAALRRHDDLALETIRFELARDGDHRLQQVIAVLGQRGGAIVVATCRELGAHRGVTPTNVTRAIREAQARVQMRLRQPERMAPIERLAGGIARICINAQPTSPPEPPKLTPRAPELRLIKGLRDGTIRPNNPGMS